MSAETHEVGIFPAPYLTERQKIAVLLHLEREATVWLRWTEAAFKIFVKRPSDYKFAIYDACTEEFTSSPGGYALYYHDRLEDFLYVKRLAVASHFLVQGLREKILSALLHTENVAKLIIQVCEHDLPLMDWLANQEYVIWQGHTFACGEHQSRESFPLMCYDVNLPLSAHRTFLFGPKETTKSERKELVKRFMTY
jgi:hypothetical protein